MILSSSPHGAEHPSKTWRQQIFSAQVRLLYRNADVGVGVTLLATAVLGRLQWGVISHAVIVGWCMYMGLISVARFALAIRYRRAAPPGLEHGKWAIEFAVGSGLAGAGWGAAGVLLFPEANLANQVLLIFVLGGMMLGGASVLAARPEAFLPFILPAGIGPAARLVYEGGETHLAMGLLAGIFTLATLATTRRIYLTIASSLNLQFENRDLVEELQAAKHRAEALNEQLEVRVEERTSELHESMERLRAEIAQREKVEEELFRARKLESLGVLAGGIAHDFNNFLTVVIGNIEIAKMRLEPGDTVQAILDQTATACQRAAFLSSQLLTFSKGGAPVRRLVSVATLVTEAVELAGAGAQTRIDVTMPKDLRSAEVDPGQIGQVLHNILINARQAMPAGGTIDVRADNIWLQRSLGVRISIRDSGAGMPADILPRIFDPYFTTKTGGSGLGLATAYAIVAKHGGNLSVESSPGRGSVFTIDLPASEESPSTEAPSPLAIRTGTEQLLIMDDDEALRKLLENVLTTFGYRVQTAGDGAEAIRLCENAKASGRGFDAVLLDVTVSGGMGGIEAAAKLKKLDPCLKLIVSSGYSDGPVLSDFRKYGFDDVLPKPWTTADISRVIRKVLSDRNA